MLSRNNIREYIKKNEPNKQRFTIKKLTVGVASVLIGITFAGTSVALADEAPANTNNGSADNNSQTGNASLNNANQVTLKSSENNAQTNTFTPNNQQAVSTQGISASLAEQPSSWPNNGKNNRLTQDQLETVKNASLQDSQNKINNRYQEEQSSEQAAANKTKPQTPAAVHNNQNVSSWSDLKAKLADSSVDQITITGNITADTPLYTGGTPNAAGTNTFNSNTTDWYGLATAENKAQPIANNGHTVTIVGANGATINIPRTMQAIKLAGSAWNITFKNITFNTQNQDGVLDLSQTNGKQSVTFENVKADGSSLYNGGGDTDVYIVGNTTSNVTTNTLATPAQQGIGDQYSSQFGTYAGLGTTTLGQNGAINVVRPAANVRAANIIIADGATFNVSRTVDGDGLVGYDGLIRNSANDNGTKTGRGNIYVGKNANLNINLKDSNLSGDALKNSERANVEIHNTGIRVNNNGTFITEDGAKVTMNVGHGRAISFGSYNVTNDPKATANYIQRADNYQTTENNPNIENNVYVGKNSTLNIMGREGLILGNRGTFISDDGSVTNINNWGSGNGFDGGDFGMFIAGPKSTVKFTSNGRKDVDGNWAHNNYFALGEDGKLVVDKDASLSVILKNQGVSIYDDNIQILSEHYHDPLVWVKDGATLDVRADASSRDAELISVPLGGGEGSRTAYFVMDNAKYINLERDSVTERGYLTPSNHNGDGNLLFMDSTNGTFFGGGRGGVTGFVGQGNYQLFKWNNKNLSSQGVQYNSTETPKENNENFYKSADQVWDGIKGFYQARNGYDTDAANMQLVADDNSDVTKKAEKGGAAFNDVQNGFSLTNSQRLVIMSHNIEPVTPDHTTDYYTKTDVDKNVIREIHYVVDDRKDTSSDLDLDQLRNLGSLADSNFTSAPTGDQVSQTNHFTGTGYIDVTTGDLVEIQKNADGTPKLDKYGHLQAVLDANGKPKPGALTWTTQADGKQGKFDASKLPTLKGDSNYQLEAVYASQNTGLAKDANGNPLYVQKQQYGKNGQPLYQNGKPVYMYAQKVDAQGNPVFNENGDPVYDYNKPLYVQAKDKNGQLLWNEDGTPKYEQQHTMSAPEKISLTNNEIPGEENVTHATATPEVYYVVYKAKNPAENHQATLSFHDDTADEPINNAGGLNVDVSPASGVEGNPISFTNGSKSVSNIENAGYVIDSISGTGITGNQKIGSYDDAAKLFGNFGEADSSFTIHFKHGAQLVDVDHPLNGNDTYNKHHMSNLTTDALTHQVTETVHYVTDNADGSVTDIDNGKYNKTDNLTFHGYTYLDKVNGNLVNQDQVADQNGNAITNTNRNSAYAIKGTVKNDNEKGKVTWEAVDKDDNGQPKTAFKGYDALELSGYKYNRTTTTPDGYADNVDKDGKISPITPIPIKDIQEITKNSPTAIDLTLHYNELNQQAGLKFVDEDASGYDAGNPYGNPAISANGIKTTYTASGKSGDSIQFGDATNTIQGTINALEGLGYEVADNQFATGANFDNDTNVDQHFVVIMKHKHQDITPDQDTNNLVKDVTRTIDYKDTEGNAVNGSPDNTATYNQHVYFVRTAVKDLVNGQIIGYDLDGDAQVDIPANFGNQAWQAATKGNDGKYTVNTNADQFADVTSKDPASLGYNNVNLPTVNGHTVNYNSPAETVHVIYSKNPTPAKEQGSITVDYYDDTAKQALTKVGTTDLGYTSGKVDSGTNIDFSTHDAQIKALQDAGYKIVSDPTTTMLKTVGNNELTYTIHVAHNITPVTPDHPGNGLNHDDLTKTVKETVHYDGAGEQTPVDHTASLTFSGTAYYDEVTKKWTDVNGKELTDQDKNKAITWTADDGTSFSVVVTPTLNGYTSKVTDTDYDDGHGNVKAINGINQNSADIAVNVKYTPEDKPAAEDQHALVNYIDADENNKLLAKSDDLTGKANTKINYSTADEITQLEKRGYVLDHDGFPANVTFDNDNGTVQTYTVVLRHGHTTVTPDKPGNPGQPIDPNNPDGPKYPDGTDINNLKKTGKQTIHYEGAGTHTPGDNKQSFDFTKTITFDNVTGKITNDSGWNVTSHTFGNVDTPVVEGYHADARTAGGQTVTPDDLTKTVTVKYAPNGKIVPVDPNHNPIPNVDQPQYPTDPTDPTRVTPDEPVPTISGMTPDQTTVTPTDPGKDTQVVYRTPAQPTQDENAALHIIDTTDANKELNSFHASGKDETAINFNGAQAYLNAMTKAGYKINGIVQATNDPNNPTKYGTDYAAAAGQWKFDKKPGIDQTFYVYLEHDYTPINPDNAFGRNDLTRTVTETVHYLNEANNQPVASDYTNTLTFKGQGLVDKATGKMLAVKSVENGQITYDYDVNNEIDIASAKDSDFVWSNPTTLAKVTSPTIAGYTIDAAKTTPSDLADGNDIKAIENVAYNHGNIEATVYYKANPVPVNDQVAVVNYVDADDGNKVIQTSGNLTGKPGAQINYSTAATIKSLENKGYELVSDGFPAGATFDNDDKTTQTYTVVLKHGHTTVTPDKPGNPGQPVDPNNPDGPKYPDGTDINNLKKTGTQTVHYTGAGDKTPADNKQSFDFTKTITFDNVTGKITADSGWNVTSHTFGSVVTPVVNGYHADKGTAGNTTVTPDNLNTTVTVNYTANGHIVPVDPNGNPIPNVPTPQYPTDPTDPTKVTPDEPVPTIPNMTPETPTVTPTDPGKDTKVVYNVPTKDQGTVNVVVHDNTTGTDLTQYGWTSGEHEIGTKVDFNKAQTIKDLENKGYEVVNPDVVVPGEITKGTTTVTINVTHKTKTVTPDQPGQPGQPVDPNNPDGPKYPAGTDKDSLQKIGTQTIHYVGAGDKTPADHTDSFTFTKQVTFDEVTGKIVKDSGWNVASHTFGSVNTPVVEGYHADARTAGGQTVTPDDLTKTVVVTYTTNGHIVPVDPNGNPIPNVDHPQFPSDPQDPTKTTNGKIPDVPGYKPTNGKPGDPVAPNEDPGKDVKVPYDAPATDQQAVVNFVDVDNGQQLATSGILSGKPGTSINQLYSTGAELQKLEAAGYELVYNGFDGDSIVKNFDNNSGVTQVFTVALKKKAQPTPTPTPEPTPQPQQPQPEPSQQPQPQQPAAPQQTVIAQPVQETQQTAPAAQLPQTGNDKGKTAGAVALGAAAAIGALGLAGVDKKKRRN